MIKRNMGHTDRRVRLYMALIQSLSAFCFGCAFVFMLTDDAFGAFLFAAGGVVFLAYYLAILFLSPENMDKILKSLDEKD